MPRDEKYNALAGITPIILVGGLGKRLWPLSRPSKPKPFIRLRCGKTFLQKTAGRVSGFMRKPYVVCNIRHRDLVTEQVDADQIMLEPQGRGTAAAVAVAAYFLSQQSRAPENRLMLVLPSDHYIEDPSTLLEASECGVEAALGGSIVAIGVKPEKPSSHYGYIKAGAQLGEGVFEMAFFTEKPDKEKARQYLQDDHVFWNSGIYLFKADVYLQALKELAPDIYEAATKSVLSATRLQNSVVLNQEAFSACSATSIDYAIVEKIKSRAVVPSAMKWRDLGTWSNIFAAWFKKQGA